MKRVSCKKASKGDRRLPFLLLILIACVFISKTSNSAPSKWPRLTVQGFLVTPNQEFSKISRNDKYRKEYYDASIFGIFDGKRSNIVSLRVSTTGYHSTQPLKNSTDGNTLYATVSSASTSITERSTATSISSGKNDQTYDQFNDKIESLEENLKKQLYDEVNASFDINSIPMKQERKRVDEKRTLFPLESQIVDDSKPLPNESGSLTESIEQRTEEKAVNKAIPGFSPEPAPSAQNTMDSPVRPSSLPSLSSEQEVALSNGEKIHMQFHKGRTGNGVAVVDIAASEEEIWSVLTDFRNYPSIIPTIRDVKVNFEYKNIITKGIFIISKFRFRLGIVHRFTAKLNRLDFSLDDDRSNYGSILELAQGFWYVEKSPNSYVDPKDNIKKSKSRVYLCADVKVNRFVPMWLVDYASERALSRATNWIVPHFEKRKNVDGADDDSNSSGGNLVAENEVNRQRLLELKRFQ